jgi:beta-glucanase (GH16 family)
MSQSIDLSNYKLTFNDEFNTLDRDTGDGGLWKTWLGNNDVNDPNSRSLAGQHTVMSYIDPEFPGQGNTPLGVNPFSVSNGILSIEAKKAPESLQPHIWGNDYTSGIISTPQISQTYGYFETRAKLPEGKGLWPAFWLVAADGSWPPEIDVFEVLGHEPGVIYQTLHGPNASQSKGGEYRGIDTSDGFHTYGVDWTPSKITWYVDGVQTYQDDNFINKPMYVIANLAVGGDWPGSPDANTQFPAKMEIDYIRSYQKDDGPVTPPPPTTDVPAAGSLSGDIGYKGWGYTMPDWMEHLYLTGTGNFSGTGNYKANTIVGNSGANTLNGVGGNDRLFGAAGNDTLNGGSGADTLTGGAGADRFVLSSTSDSRGSSRDTIFDFKPAEGDKIVLSRIDANTQSSGNQAFSFVDEGSFTGRAGQLQAVDVSGGMMVRGDVNGDKIADFEIMLAGFPHSVDLSASHFVL